MKLKEEYFHLLFKIEVMLKGIDGLPEAMGGVALFFASRASLRGLAILALIGPEYWHARNARVENRLKEL
ncbi:MAG: hypothetical protein ACREDS_02860 [Limisphaerales bacterium]